jgi:PGF-CTERM protein
MTARSQPAAVLVAAVVVLSTVVAGVAVVGAQDAGGASGTNATGVTNGTDVDLPPADDVYVKENGDAVLAYQSETSNGRTNFGLNVTKGLFHALVVTDLNGTSNVTGNATAILTGDNFTGNGSLAVPRPEALSNLSVNVTGTQTNENARSDATVSATLKPTNARTISALPVTSAQTSGNVTISASNFSAAAEAHAKLSRPLGQPQHQEFRISEQGSSYTLNASQEYTVSSFATQQWSSRQRAKQTLRQRYVAIAERLGGRADLTLESYSFTKQRSGSRLDIEYSVTYHGIERALTNQLTTRLTASRNIDLNQSEANTISQQLRNLTVQEVYARYDQRRRSIDAAMRVNLKNYDGAVLAALKVGQSVNMEAMGAANASAGLQSNISASLDQYRKRFKARQAADLVQRYTFAANVSKQSNRAITVNAELHSRTKNWSQYIQELQDRGIKTSNVHYELHATTEGERVNVTAAVEVSGENFLRRASNQLLNTTAGGETSTRKYVKAFREAGFRKARMDLSLHNGRMRVEAGAAFQNMTALRDALATTEQGRNFQSAVGRTENGTTKSYVRLTGAVPANATEEDVRQLPSVTDDTAIHMPNTWNKTFPTTNTTRAKNYLGLTGTASGLTGPGFGIAVAVVALLAAALVAVRRRH